MGFMDNYFRKRIGSMSAEEIAPLITGKLDSLYMNNDLTSGSGIHNPYRVQKQELENNPEQFVHRHIVLEKRAFFVDNPQHRNIMAYYHPWMHAAVFRIAEELTSEEPLFCKPGSEEDEEPEIMEEILKGWRKYRLQEAWRKCFEKDAIHGISIYYPLNTINLDWYTGPPWRIVSWDEIDGEPAEFRLGHPIRWLVNPSNKELDPFECDITNSVFFDSSNSDDFIGVPRYLAMWDDCIDYLMIKDALNSFDQRMGNGFMVIVIPYTTTDAEKTQIEDRIRNIRTEKGLVIRGRVEEPVTIDWMKLSDAQVDFVSHLSKIEEVFVNTIGFPKRFLLGDQEGAMESSGKDMLQINIKLKNIFKRWIIWMKRVLKYHGIIQEFDDVAIRPSFGMNLSEQERITLENLKTQTIANKAWLTVNEKRELDGYDPLSDEDEEEVIGMGFGGGENNNGEENKDGAAGQKEGGVPNGNREEEPDKQPKKDSVEAFIQENSLSTIAQTLGISIGTASKIRNKFDSDRKPKFHEIFTELSCKTDSVDSRTVDFQGILITPVSKEDGFEYESGVRDIRDVEEIKRWFESNTPKTIYGGVTQNDDHISYIRSEILRSEAVAIAQAYKMDDSGRVLIKGKISLDAVNERLGPKNWVEDYIVRGDPIPISVALWSRDKWVDKKTRRNTELDVRSFVLTRKPRNNGTFIKI